LFSLRNRLQFLAERFLVRGPLFRLLFVVGIVATVSVLGGIAVVGTGQFGDLAEAVWWAFLRLTDPGYLGDDQGAYVRTVSTLLTVTGYVLFLGALIAIMTQWLNAALRRLENGLTPIADRNHFVVVGWTNRTPTIVGELLSSSERVRRFLRLRGARSLTVVVMAEEVDAQLQQDLRERIGDAYRASSVILRSGSPLRGEHLRRVAALDAAALLMPAPSFDDPRVAPDTQTIKTLLSLWGYCRENDVAAMPLVVAEVLDARNALTARRAYPGPLEVVATSRLVSSLLCQNIRHPGISHVFAALLTHGEGSELYARDCPAHFFGVRFGDLADAFPQAILLGIVRRGPDGTDHPHLNPSDDMQLVEGDRFVLVAEDLESTDPPAAFTTQRPDRGEGVPSPPEVQAHRRILVLGWSHHVPSLLQELDTYELETFEVVSATIVPVEQRLQQLEDADLDLKRVRIEHRTVDFTTPGHLRDIDPRTFDNVLLVASDRIESEEADARTILGHLLLREIVPDGSGGPQVLVELADAENLTLFQRGASEVLTPATLVSHMMAQIALRSELRVVFEDLFGPEGPEIFFRPAADYGLGGCDVDFEAIRRAVAGRNETALGVRLLPRGGEGDGEVLVNPPRDRTFTLSDDDQLVVVATYG
jgi:hypothetical protein